MIEFRSSIGYSTFADPRNGFAPVESPCEIRVDPLTGSHTRIAHMAMPPRLHRGIPEIVREKAPPVFSPPLVDEVTPTFPASVVPEGRMKRGRSTLFPNLNPYEVWSPVVAVGDRAYVEAPDLDAGDVGDALALLRDFLARLPKRVAASAVVGWNFLPASGSSIPHPHIQAVASNRLPDRQRRERRGELSHARGGGDFWSELVEVERRGERWLGSRRRWSALVAFAPRSVVPETLLVHDRVGHLLDASDATLGGLADWLCRLAAVHHEEGIYSFNVIINPGGPQRGAPSRLRARFLPRVYIVEPTFSSDLFWVNLGTEEGVTPLLPEDWAATVRARLG